MAQETEEEEEKVQPRVQACSSNSFRLLCLSHAMTGTVGGSLVVGPAADKQQMEPESSTRCQMGPLRG